MTSSLSPATYSPSWSSRLFSAVYFLQFIVVCCCVMCLGYYKSCCVFALAVDKRLIVIALYIPNLSSPYVRSWLHFPLSASIFCASPHFISHGTASLSPELYEFACWLYVGIVSYVLYCYDIVPPLIPRWSDLIRQMIYGDKFSYFSSKWGRDSVVSIATVTA